MRHVFAPVALAALSTIAMGQTRLYVNAAAAPGGNGSSWSQALDDLQPALQLAVSQPSVQEIWVAAGTYTPDEQSNDPTRSFAMRSGLRVIGGFAGIESSIAQRDWRSNVTVLSGDLGEDHSYHVVLALGVDDAALLDGFHITGGMALGAGAHANGGGILAEQSQLQISNCILRNNHAKDGGAAYFYESAAVLVNCVVIGNRATASVAGVLFQSAIGSGFNPSVINCTFTGNIATSRTRSSALYGGMTSGNVLVRNCILWDNDYTALTLYPGQMGGRIDGAYCCVSESPDWPGSAGPAPGTIYQDPGLVLAMGADGVFGTIDDDVRLSHSSLCIDAGDVSSLPLDRFDLDGDGNTSEPFPLDLEGRSRIYDDPNTPNGGAGHVDFGAFEGPAFGVVAAAAALNVPEGGSADAHVRLTRAPASSLAIGLVFDGDPDIGSSVSQVTFGPADWNTLKPVPISAAEDSDSFQGTATVEFSAPGVLDATITLNEVENDAPPGVVYVTPGGAGGHTGGSWSEAFATLEDALTYAAGSGGVVQEVWVAAGVYTPTGPSFALPDGIAVYGGFAGSEVNLLQRDWTQHLTILSGDVLGDDGPNFTNRADNKVHVLRATGAGPATRLDGFVIRGGNAMSQATNEGRQGGGMHLAVGDQPTIVNCTFTDNRARNGGGMFVRYSGTDAPGIHNCQFIANAADEPSGNGYGGGLFIEQSLAPGEGLILEGCRFDANQARNEGGGLSLFVSEAVLLNCEFENNSLLDGNGFGAGAWIRLTPFGINGDLEILGTTFSGHNTTGNQQGAGLYLVGRGTALFDGCTVSGNNATSNTSAIRAVQSSAGLSLTLLSSSFVDNHGGFGGGISMVATLTLMDECLFAGNTAGAAAAGTLNGLVRNTAFLDNVAWRGGAVLTGGNSRFENCTFIGNEATGSPSSSTAVGGGAVEAHGAYFIDCMFRDNHATGTNASGGAILGNDGARVARCTFIGNSATFGGAVHGFWTSQENLVIVNSTMVGNEASSQGGAFYGHGILSNNAIVGNHAASVGGGIYGAWGVLTLRNCTIGGNTADTAGGVYMLNNQLQCYGSVLWGNGPSAGGSGTQGEQVAKGSSASMAFSYNRLQGWSGTLGGVGNGGGDPVFFDLDGPDDILGTHDDSVQLSAESSCIDAGSNLQAPPDTLDLNGNLNTTEPIDEDIFARPRFQDDPNTPDTGEGTAPLIDIGAAEYEPLEFLFNPCYANCDGSTVAPVLNVADFSCFLQHFAAGNPYANCDGSVTPPVLNVADFGCFLQLFAAGCP